MAMGRKKGVWQEELFYANEVARSPGHPFYDRLNRVLADGGFDARCESQCAKFYHGKLGRPGLAPGVYFRLLLIGFFEGIGSEREIAWRVADSLSLREFIGYQRSEATPDHVTVSRTRRLLDEATHPAVFDWVLTEVVRRMDRKRKKRTSNKDWVNPHDPDAAITKMKNGATHLAYKAEQAVDLDTGVIVAITTQGGATGDTDSVSETLCAAGVSVAAQIATATVDGKYLVNGVGVEELVTDKGFHETAPVVNENLSEIFFPLQPKLPYAF